MDDLIALARSHLRQIETRIAVRDGFALPRTRMRHALPASARRNLVATRGRPLAADSTEGPMTMDDLIAFIRARLDEDEHIARQAAWAVADHTYAPADVDDQKTEMTGHWVARGVLGIHKRVTVSDPGWDPKVTDTVWSQVGDHIARHDPDRAFREVAGKWAILAIHHPTQHDYRKQVCNGCGYTGDLDEPNTDDINECPMLRVVASVYSDHPDYRQEWKP